MERRIFENSFLRLRLEGNILYCTFAEGLRMDIQTAKMCVGARISFAEGKSYPCMIDMRGISYVTKEAREFMANQGSHLIIAGALIVQSPLSRTIGNIFLTLNKPKAPARLFTDEETALDWLQAYIVKSGIKV